MEENKEHKKIQGHINFIEENDADDNNYCRHAVLTQTLRDVFFLYLPTCKTKTW